MLKPKKKITIKEIKKDPLLETLYQVQTKYQDNKKFYFRIVFGVLAVVVVVLFLNNRRSNVNNVADTDLGKAIVSIEIGDLENAQLQLEILLDDHSSTKSGKLANYFLGKIYYDQQDYIRAENALLKFTAESSVKLLLPNAHQMLADMYKRADNAPEAEKHLHKSIKHSQNPIDKQAATLALADFLIHNGQPDQALELVNSVLEKEDLSARIRQLAEELSGQLSG